MLIQHFYYQIVDLMIFKKTNLLLCYAQVVYSLQGRVSAKGTAHQLTKLKRMTKHMVISL